MDKWGKLDNRGTHLRQSHHLTLYLLRDGRVTIHVSVRLEMFGTTAHSKPKRSVWNRKPPPILKLALLLPLAREKRCPCPVRVSPCLHPTAPPVRSQAVSCARTSTRDVE